jgi:hypothetical protein
LISVSSQRGTFDGQTKRDGLGRRRFPPPLFVRCRSFTRLSFYPRHFPLSADGGREPWTKRSGNYRNLYTKVNSMVFRPLRGVALLKTTEKSFSNRAIRQTCRQSLIVKSFGRTINSLKETTSKTPRLKFEKALQTPRRQGGKVRTEADAQGTFEGAFVRHGGVDIGICSRAEEAFGTGVRSMTTRLVPRIRKQD